MKSLKIRKVPLLITSASGLVIFLVLFFGPPGLYELSSSPEFCNTCHVMNDQYEAWFMTGVHRPLKCVDCHLPHNNPVNHLVWKGISGTWIWCLFIPVFFQSPCAWEITGKKPFRATASVAMRERFSWSILRGGTAGTATGGCATPIPPWLETLQERGPGCDPVIPRKRRSER
jgi:cytochrome c nitrite reductase small subunit